jgi:hypothetical protein
MAFSWYSKPYQPFFLTAIITLLIAASYFMFSPGSEFDLEINEYFSVKSSYAWFVLSFYLFSLAALYFTATKNKLKTRKWLVTAHFIFVMLFLLIFFLFSTFNTSYVQRLVSNMQFLVLMAIYGALFLLDVIFFLVSLILLIVNIFMLKKE